MDVKKGCLSQFLKKKKDSESEDSGLSSTEDFALEEDGDGWDEHSESLFREEARKWLAINAQSLFSLEVSKHLAREKKQHAVRPVLSRGG